MEAWSPLIAENAKIPVGQRIKMPEATLKLTVENNNKPVYVPQYRLPLHVQSKVDERIETWVAKGYVKRQELVPMEQMSNNPITTAPKKNAQGDKVDVHICMDTRVLNRLILDDPQPTPSVPDIVMQIDANSQVFMILDQTDAYHGCALNDPMGYCAFTHKFV